MGGPSGIRHGGGRELQNTLHLRAPKKLGMASVNRVHGEEEGRPDHDIVDVTFGSLKALK